MNLELFPDLEEDEAREEAVDYLQIPVNRGRENLREILGGRGGPGSFHVQIGGYVPDPPEWDHVRPLRKLSFGEMAVWRSGRTYYFQIDEIAEVCRSRAPRETFTRFNVVESSE